MATKSRVTLVQELEALEIQLSKSRDEINSKLRRVRRVKSQLDRSDKITKEARQIIKEAERVLRPLYPEKRNTSVKKEQVSANPVPTPEQPAPTAEPKAKSAQQKKAKKIGLSPWVVQMVRHLATTSGPLPTKLEDALQATYGKDWALKSLKHFVPGSRELVVTTLGDDLQKGPNSYLRKVIRLANEVINKCRNEEISRADYSHGLSFVLNTVDKDPNWWNATLRAWYTAGNHQAA